jgi:Tfp pilus assembly protein PilN
VTIISSEQRLGMTSAQMPRVNLIPPEIAEKAMFRKVQMGLGVGVAAAVGVVGLLTLSASHGVSSAQDSLDQATAKSTTLIAQKAKFNNVTAIHAAADAAQAQLTTAMGQEVRYSQLMHDLSLSVPSTVWLKGMTFTQAAPAASTPGAAVTGTAGATTAAAAPTSIGTVTFTGVGFDHNDLALWLESLASLKAYNDPYFSSSVEALLNNVRKVVNFSSTANITPAALSGRYTKPLGG